ncbi:MAG: MFS transporter [Fimbriimonadaceae bacterium]
MNPPTLRGGFRWTICALIFFATTVNYLDRQLFSVLVPFFEDDLKLGPTDLALINVSFILPYGIVMIFVGRFIDRVGLRRGLSATYLLWSAASIGHAVVTSLTGFMGVRFLLGVGESGMYPAGVKTITDWFPRKERALGTGIFNAGANCGAFLAPMLGVFIAQAYGWKFCFVVTGFIGLIWLLFWQRYYREPERHPRVSAAELDYIRSDREGPPKPISYSQLFAIRPVYGLMIGKALSDAPWWFYLTWMPVFLIDQFHLTPVGMAVAIPIIYVVADVGSVGGGWMSSFMIRRGVPVGPARKRTMLACALLVVPVMSIGGLVGHGPIFGIPCAGLAVAIVALAAGAHQGWSSNLFTLISDTVPSGSMAMAVGAINGAAMIGVSAFQFFVGRAVQLTSSYTLPFVVAGGLYLVALVVIHLFIPEVRMCDPVRAVKLSWVWMGAFAVVAGLGWLLYETNRPPYLSLADYRMVRRTELKAVGDPQPGPVATVAWMDARWYRWPEPGGQAKIELIKFDRAGRPIVESKGAKAPKYKGPTLATVTNDFTAPR